MSKIDEYIAKRSARDSEFSRLAEQEDINLEVAVKVRNLREELGLTQQELADLVGKPQSTIARIENASMNASTRLLKEIAKATGQTLTIGFEPAY